MWANCESFTWEKGTNDRSSALIPAAFSRVLSQMHAASAAGADRIISFITCGMWDQPGSPYPLGQPTYSCQVYEDYMAWLSGDKYWKAAEHSITNGAEENLNDPRWIRFPNAENEHTINLGKNSTAGNSILVRALNCNKKGITPPDSFTLHISEDGKSYKKHSETKTRKFPNNLHDTYIDYILFPNLPKSAVNCKITFTGPAYCTFIK